MEIYLQNDGKCVVSHQFKIQDEIMRADVLNKNIPSINNLIAHRSIAVLYGVSLGVICGPTNARYTEK